MLKQRSHRCGRDQVLKQVLKIKDATQFKHPPDFFERLPPMWDVMHDAVINDDVERGIRRRNRLGIADKNAGSIPILQHTLVCQHDRHWIKIEAGDMRCTEGEQNFDAQSPATTNFQPTLPVQGDMRANQQRRLYLSLHRSTH